MTDEPLASAALASPPQASPQGVAVPFAACANLPPENADRWHVYAMMGLSESSSNIILGASMLALTWLVTAIGLRRLAVREAR